MRGSSTGEMSLAATASAFSSFKTAPETPYQEKLADKAAWSHALDDDYNPINKKHGCSVRQPLSATTVHCQRRRHNVPSLGLDSRMRP